MSGASRDFLNPWDDQTLLKYFSSVRDWHGYLRFLGLPHLREKPDVPIWSLYVEPRLAGQHVSPDTSPKDWPESMQRALDVLCESERVVLLGDPGSGKSSLVSWIAWQFARPEDSPWTSRLGPLIPIPIVLRDLPIGADITWDSLLNIFLEHKMAKPLARDRDTFDKVLNGGRAFFLIDGIDEIGIVTVRRALKNALYDGMIECNRCRWLMTSRIVGYDAVPFHDFDGDDEDDESLHSPYGNAFPEEYPTWALPTTQRKMMRMPPRDATMAGMFPEVRYLAPFDDGQIAQFARNWYERQEGGEALRKDGAQMLLDAIEGDENTHRLARVPNLLVMMALIHRHRAQLPHGRANLYDDIAEAYLESIDKFRKLTTIEYSLDEKRGWLARVGYEMQCRRAETKSKKESGREILVEERVVVGWVIDAMKAVGRHSDDAEKEAGEFIDYIARRSGLLIPRGDGLFAFVHLSFQEYFAACCLRSQITGPRWLPRYGDKGDAAPDALLAPNKLVELANNPVWRETFSLLFELLPTEHRWPDETADWIFGGPNFERLFDEDKTAENTDTTTEVLAAIAVDPYSGLSDQRRKGAFAAAWRHEIKRQQSPILGIPVPAILTGAPEATYPQALAAFKKTVAQIQPSRLNLSGCPSLSDVRALAGLEKLDSLNLSGCTSLRYEEPREGLEKIYRGSRYR